MYAIMLIVLRVNNFMSRLRVTRVVFDSSNLSFFFFCRKNFCTVLFVFVVDTYLYSIGPVYIYIYIYLRLKYS